MLARREKFSCAPEPRDNSLEPSMSPPATTTANSIVPSRDQLSEPRDPKDARDWRRITVERPPLGNFPNVDMQGWGLKLSSSVMSPWDKRWFIFVGNFICYFRSQDPTARCSGCYYMPGMVVERLAEIPNHPSAPVHFNSYKENCVLFRPVVPRKPGSDYRDLILSLPDEIQLQRWEAYVSALSKGRRPTSVGSSYSVHSNTSPIGSPPSVDLGGCTNLGSSIGSLNLGGSGTRSGYSSPVSPPNLGSPTILGSPSYSSGSPAVPPGAVKVQLGGSAKGHMPPQYQAMLKYSGITQEEAANNSAAVVSVFNFAQQRQQGLAQPPEPTTLHDCLGGTRQTKERYTLAELASPEDALVVHKGIVKLDSGSQGEVYKAVRAADGVPVALKKIFMKNEAKELPALENEISMMYTSKHKNIVNFYSAHRKEGEKFLYIAMELMTGGKLTDVLDNNPAAFSEEQLAYICKNVLEGLAYLHGKGRMHRDIKSDNILLGSDGEIKLGDFGFCASLAEGENQKRQTVVGTPYWMAPEVITGEPYDCKADVWSMGILALELCDGEPPLMAEPPMRALYIIVTQPSPTMKSPEKWSDSCKDFISSMLQKDPEERPGAAQLLKHPFLAKACSGDFLHGASASLL